MMLSRHIWSGECVYAELLRV